MSISEIFRTDDLWDDLRGKVDAIIVSAKQEAYEHGWEDGYTAGKNEMIDKIMHRNTSENVSMGSRNDSEE